MPTPEEPLHFHQIENTAAAWGREARAWRARALLEQKAAEAWHAAWVAGKREGVRLLLGSLAVNLIMLAWLAWLVWTWWRE